MSVLVVGSTALDSIKTPTASAQRLMGGSACHASVAASFFSPVHLVGIVGEDYPSEYTRLLQRRSINLDGLQVAPGKTFHWSGEYEVNMNNRRTLATELGVFEAFRPDLPPHLRGLRYVLLANIAPSLQLHVLAQLRRPKFVVADTMDLWLNIALKDLLRLIKKVDALVVNDSEARQLTNEANLPRALRQLHRLGPEYVIVKKGEHGAVLSSPRGLFIAPAFPLENLTDPTGAGDSFVGGLLGYLAASKGSIDHNLRRAIVHGSAVASFCCEGFGLQRTSRIKRADIDARVRQLERLSRF